MLSMAAAMHGRLMEKMTEVHEGHDHKGAPEQEVLVMKMMAMEKVVGFNNAGSSSA